MPELAFPTVGIIGKFEDPSVAEAIRELAACLTRLGARVLLDQSTSVIVPIGDMETASRDRLGELCDLAVVMGGDGTFLNTVRSLYDGDVALLGINLGRLGFLTDVPRSRMAELLEEIMAGRYREERRSLLHAEIRRDDHALYESDAFNDVVIHREMGRIIEFETRVDGHFVATHRSDGLIVSTPTGSTAYALSSGGPLMYPTLDAMVLVPICPHALSNRPLVVHADSRVEVVIHDTGHNVSQVTCDGQVSAEIRPGDRVLIRRRSRKVRLIHPESYDYFGILREKLKWGEVL